MGLPPASHLRTTTSQTSRAARLDDARLALGAAKAGEKGGRFGGWDEIGQAGQAGWPPSHFGQRLVPMLNSLLE